MTNYYLMALVKHIILDYVQKWTKVGVIFGTNAITAYVIHAILFFPFILITFGIDGYEQTTIEIFVNNLIYIGFDPELASLMWGVFYSILCFFPVWALYKWNVYVKA